MSRIASVRERRKAAFLERTGVKLTYTPFLARAAVSAARVDGRLDRLRVEGLTVAAGAERADVEHV